MFYDIKTVEILEENGFCFFVLGVGGIFNHKWAVSRSGSIYRLSH
jgi:hypothetical protein